MRNKDGNVDLVAASEGSPSIALPAQSADTIRRAREEFFAGSHQPADLVPERILLSWQRCAGLGLAPNHPDRDNALSHAELTVSIDHPELLSLAKPGLEFLEAALTSSQSVIAFTDSRGTVVDSRGGPSSSRMSAKRVLAPGESWSERSRGTNGIGTALADGHLVEVWGGEHFHEDYSGYCCTAAPFLDHTGETAGVINVTGDARLPRGYARALVKQAVRELEFRWITQIGRRFNVFNFHPQFSYLDSSQAGVLLLDNDRVVGANRYALRWLGMNWNIIGKSWDDCFESPMPAPGGGPLVPRKRMEFAYEMKIAKRSSAKISPPPARALPKPSKPLCGWFPEEILPRLDRARRAANAGLTTIILGETGTGKEMFARMVHRESMRASKPFVAVNCAAIPETLIESELFGYGPGAFTGAKRSGSQGRIVEANGGILFLDEIGDMPFALQARLLRVLQDKVVTPLGGGSSKPVDLVVLCATHRDIEGQVRSGSFRADLYYRLNHLIIRLPAWRLYSERDRLAAVDFLWQCSQGEAKGVRLSEQARREFASCAFPGNLRQCANIITTLVALSEHDTVIEADALPPEVRFSAGTTRPRDSLDLNTLSALAVQKALERHDGDVASAAKELGIHRATLYRRLKNRRS